MAIASRSWLPLLGVALITLLVHGFSLRSGYVYDDVEAILENQNLRDFSKLPALFRSPYWGENSIGLYRPLVQVSYLMEGATVGFIPKVSHGVNAVLHALVAVLLSVFLTRLGFSPGQAFTAATLFGVHPALLDASVWISGRTDVLSAGFVLLALIAAEKAARSESPSFKSARVLAVALLWLAALLSKEMAGTLPLFLLLRHGRAALRFAPALGGALLVYVVLRASAIDGFFPPDGGQLLGNRPLLERMALGSRACLRLLALLPVPVGLASDHRAHPYAAADAAIGLTGFFSLLSVVFVLPWIAWRNRGRGPLPFLLAATLCSLLPILQIIPIGAVMAERFLYLPSAFVLPWLVILCGRLPLPSVRLAMASLAILVAASLTFVRLPVYATRASFSLDALRAYPEDVKAWNNLGIWYAFEQEPLDFAAADAAFAKALTIDPKYRRGRLNRVRARLREHRLTGRAGALTDLETMLEPFLAREDGDALYLSGKIYLRRAPSGKTADERAVLDTARTLYERAALAFESRGKKDQAAAAWKESGIASERLSATEQKRTAWARSLELRPHQAGASAMRRALDR